MPDINNDAYSIPEDVLEQRKKNVDLYLEARKNTDPKITKAVRDAIMESDSYKDITAKRKALWQEKSADKKRCNELLTEEEKNQAEKAKLEGKPQINKVEFAESEEQSIENLPNTAQAQKRTDMENFAEENDPWNFEKIKWWHAKINELRATWAISDSAEWVKIRWIWTLASTATHNRILKEKFDWKIQEELGWTNHSWNKSEVSTVRKDDLEIFLSESDGELVSGNFRVPWQDFVTWNILPWIEYTFGWNLDQNDKLYILQMINPDLFTRLWFNSKKSSGYQAMLLGRTVSIRNFNTFYNDDSRCGLFLVWNA